MNEIEALVCVRRILKDEIQKIEDSIKSLVCVNPMTQVRYQTLTARVWLYGNKEKIAEARSNIFRALDKAYKDLAD